VRAVDGWPSVGPIDPFGYWLAGVAGAGCGWAACCASAGNATIAAAADAISRGLMRITLRDIDFDGVRGLLFGQRREEE